jgi:hypothetical protein
MGDRAFVVLFMVLAILAIVFGPILMIWSLNTLFGLGIAYTFWTWLAALILGGTLTARASAK